MKLKKRYFKRIKRIARANGMDRVMAKLYEELGELRAAIADFGDAAADDSDPADLRLPALHVIEEMADVRIMLDQASNFYPREAQREFLDFKVFRELCRKRLGDSAWCATHPEF